MSDPQHPTACVIGLGSHHGDDQAGWRVVDWLAEHRGSPHAELSLFRALGPYDLLDQLVPNRATWIIDACQIDTGDMSYYRILWPRQSLAAVHAPTSHSGSLQDALELATLLHRCPSAVVIFAIPGANWRPGDTIGPEIALRIEQAAQAVLAELSEYFES